MEQNYGSVSYTPTWIFGVFGHPRQPQWRYKSLKNFSLLRQQDTSIVNSFSVRPNYPITKLAAFDLCGYFWPTLDRLRTVEGQCADKLNKWRIASSVKCSCGQPQTMNHLVELCPLTALANGALPQLHVHCAGDYCLCICIVHVFYFWQFCVTCHWFYYLYVCTL